ncbi:MAG: methyltransferase domain-containing protein [Chloroflexi bacterium]|nr:methyltransferase domain-containing protein [Chloroflexota bacterium]
MPSTDTDWDATRYHRLAQPHAAWGANVLDRLRLRGDEVVLDAGCGSGKVTAQLLERLPSGRVIGADLSPAMLAEARASLASFGAQVSFVQTDLLDIDRALERERHAPVDAIFSTATFHWLDDHARLFGALHRSVKRRGRLVSQFGGGANLAGLMRAADAVAARAEYLEHLHGKALWRFYYSPEQTRDRLEACGFSDVDAWLEDSPQTFPDAQSLADFARAVVLRNHVNALPTDLQDAFLLEVTYEVARIQGAYVLDYVRLNADATA